MSHFGSADFLIEVAKGNVAGHSLENLVMRSKNIVSTGFTDIWGFSGNLVLPTAAETWQVRSISSDDTLLGAGARKVLITYLDDSYLLKTVIAELNGTTAVTLNTDHFRPRSVVVIDSDPAVRHNVGNIIVETSGAVARGFIEETFSASQDTSYTVPADTTVFFLKQSPYWEKNEDGDIMGFLGIEATNTDITGGIFPAYQNTFDIEFIAPLRIEAKTDIRFRAQSTNATVPAFSFVHEFLVVENAFL